MNIKTSRYTHDKRLHEPLSGITRDHAGSRLIRMKKVLVPMRWILKKGDNVAAPHMYSSTQRMCKNEWIAFDTGNIDAQSRGALIWYLIAIMA